MPAIYDRIGGGYDTVRRADPGLTRQLCDRLQLEPDCRMLDVGCGTANYTQAIGQRCRIVGLDVSEIMLKAAAAKQPRLCLVRGTALSLPFADQSFDRVLTTLSIHHWPDMERGIAEVRRVLRQGPYVLFAFFWEQMATYWFRHYFPRNFDLSPDRTQTRDRILGALNGAGFSRVSVEPWEAPRGFADHFLYTEIKHDPLKCLDPAVRGGSSFFRNPADPGEIAEGLARLDADIASGRIADIVARDNDPDGDYVLITAWP